jgi:XTP/dITP diphosphohydrolase
MPKDVDFKKLVTIMDELSEKCPWDKKQTLASLKPMTIEETYELGDALDAQNWKNIKEELGDLLLHIVFYSKIAAENNAFTINDVIEGICEKLILRHPHVYGNITVKDDEEVKKNWEQLKLKEGKTSVLSGIPKTMPALAKATGIQEKVKQVGFEWDEIESVWEKISEETNELKQAIQFNSNKEVKEELGDVLFSWVNLAREKTNQKFIQRFKLMENMAAERNLQLANLTLAEMDELWNIAKMQIKNEPS